ncbi:hypothetical protein QBC46DRAFT_436589 [Diplogelasinospora grovesii]|uniref:Uncharacterized protein n=1 Tax=Diplogelasinospora grovesii TaxID=303347 RepID=A0AAN6N631_9PEZI|nr:hypothetical protein QBC46DRAFT_436589 [Diplogelasinospora grovesii]
MCKGYTVELVCGHKLMHFSARCFNKLGDCQQPDGPVTSICDTCAACHMPHQIDLINKKYDEEARRTMELKLIAEKNGRFRQADLMERELRRIHADRAEALARAARSRFRGCIEVIWPGKREEFETDHAAFMNYFKKHYARRIGKRKRGTTPF